MKKVLGTMAAVIMLAACGGSSEKKTEETAAAQMIYEQGRKLGEEILEYLREKEVDNMSAAATGLAIALGSLIGCTDHPEQMFQGMMGLVKSIADAQIFTKPGTVPQ